MVLDHTIIDSRQKSWDLIPAEVDLPPYILILLPVLTDILLLITTLLTLLVMVFLTILVLMIQVLPD